MNCSSCGNAVQQGDSFCMYCGAFLPEQPSPASETTASLGQPKKEGATAPPAQEPPVRPAETPASSPVSEPWLPRAEPNKYSAPESSFLPTPDDEGVPGAGVRYNSSKGRWIGLAVVLVCLFLLAAIGGYLLQRRGAEPPQAGDVATAEAPPDRSAQAAQNTDAPSPVDAYSAGAADSAAADASSAPAADEAPASPSVPARPQAAKASPNTPPARKPEPSRVEAKPALQESSPTPPPTAFETPAANPLPDPGPAQTQKLAAAQKPAETALVAEAEASGDVRGRRAPPNTRVLIPGEQPPAAHPAVVPDAGPGRKQPPAPAATEEGIIYWTGRLQKNQVIVIEGGRASVGQIDGKLPGTPIDVWLPSPAVVLAERPNAGNNWSRVAFRCVQNTSRNVTINVQWKRLR